MTLPKKFHIDVPVDKPQDWMPRGINNIGRKIDAGLRDITHDKRQYNRFGVTDVDMPLLPSCRFCGANQRFVEETNDAIVVGCNTDNCPNNQDSKAHDFLINMANKRPIGKVEEEGFEQGL